MRYLGIVICLFIGLMLAVSMRIETRKPALTQKLTLERMLTNPLQAMKKIFKRIDCDVQSSNAAIQVYSESSDPGECACTPPFDTLADAWNNCTTCFFMSLVGVYNSFASTFSLAIDPDLNIDATVNINEEPLSVLSTSSPLEAYERQTTLADADGNICLSIFYTKHVEDSERVKGLFHLDTSECPATESDGSAYAMVMIFDTGYTSANLQTGELIAAINPDGEFDLTAGQDQLFYMKLQVSETTGIPITTSHSYLMAANNAWKYFVNGQDDTRLLIGTLEITAFADTTLDGSDLTTGCLNDATNADAGSDCDDAGYALSDFPYTVNSMSTLIFPDWTSESLSVESEDIRSYFQAPE